MLSALVLLSAAAACSNTKPYSSQCAYIIGAGTGDSHQLKRVVYPNHRFDKGDDKAWFVPCNVRNFIINPEGLKNANNQQIGDRHDPAYGKTRRTETEPGVQMKVWLSTTWQLNHTREALAAFLPVCEKYRCYTTSAEDAGNANFSTSGWNGMLGETMSQAVNTAVQRAVSEFDEHLDEDQKQWVALGKKVAEYFMEAARARTGAAADVFCKPGVQKEVKDDFTGPCEPPEWIIDKVEPVNKTVANQRDQSVIVKSEDALNKARVEQAKRLYGPYAEYFLGLQDTIEKCKDAGSTCIVNLGGSPPGISITPPK